jgi:hypothetical protein
MNLNLRSWCFVIEFSLYVALALTIKDVAGVLDTIQTCVVTFKYISVLSDVSVNVS